MEFGKHADLIAVDDDSLDDVSALEDVDFVMKGRIVYKRNGRPGSPPQHNPTRIGTQLKLGSTTLGAGHLNGVDSGVDGDPTSCR